MISKTIFKMVLASVLTIMLVSGLRHYKNQSHKVDSLNNTIITTEQQKANAEAELLKAKENEKLNTDKIKQLEDKIKQLEADLQAKNERKQYLASLSQPERWLLEAGIPENDWSSAYELVRRESTWNPNAINPTSGACGLAQSLPCNKIANAGLQWNNPVHALKWQYEYVKQRYGGYSQALAFHSTKNWY